MEQENKVTKQEILGILDEFENVTNRLQRTNPEDGISNLERFVNYINNNAIINEFVKQHNCIEFNMDSVMRNYPYLKNPIPNTSLSEEISFLYQLLKYGIAEYNFGKGYLFFVQAFCGPTLHPQKTLNDFANTAILPLYNHILIYLKKLLRDIEIDYDKNIKLLIQNNYNLDRTINTGGGNYSEDIQGNYIQGNDSSRNVNISGGTVNASGAGALSSGDINGIVANTINQSSSPQQTIFGGNINVSGSINVGNITQISNFGTTNQPIDLKESLPTKRTILVLASSPVDLARLRLDQEVREIDEGLRRSQKRSQFDLQQKWAVRPDDLRRALLDYNPQIIHFAGHGTGEQGLVLENQLGVAQLVKTDALAALFSMFTESGLECVVLNACYAEVQAEAIAEYVKYVIGMKSEVSDVAAVKFATGFYDALGAGWTYEKAFEMGRNAIALEGLPEDVIPVFKSKLIKQREEHISQQSNSEQVLITHDLNKLNWQNSVRNRIN